MEKNFDYYIDVYLELTLKNAQKEENLFDLLRTAITLKDYEQIRNLLYITQTSDVIRQEVNLKINELLAIENDKNQKGR